MLTLPSLSSAQELASSTSPPSPASVVTVTYPPATAPSMRIYEPEHLPAADPLPPTAWSRSFHSVGSHVSTIMVSLCPGCV